MAVSAAPPAMLTRNTWPELPDNFFYARSL